MKKIKEIYRRISSPIVIIGTLFFIFGFITWLSAVLVPYLKIACELNNFQSYLVAFSFYIAYFFMSVHSGWLLEHTGYKKGMTIGLLVMALGSVIFVPAALTRTYGLFLTGLFIQGAGMALLQTASNPYVTIIGPIENAISHEISLARSQLKWIVGKNPSSQSLMYGEGYDISPQYATFPGDVTGGLPVGIQTKLDSDLPFWPACVLHNYKEIWIHPSYRWLELLNYLGYINID